MDTTKPYDEIYATLFSNSLHSLGLAPIDEWRFVISRARKNRQFIGVNEQKYPKDLASATRHYTELKKLDQRYPIPESLTLDQLDTFLAQVGNRSSVRWIEEPAVLST